MSDLMTGHQRPRWPADLLEKAAAIRLLALDVDGIMTDGKLYFSANGDELKGFNILDGLGIKQAMAAGIDVAVITGRRSPLTAKRMDDLGIPHLMQGKKSPSRNWQASLAYPRNRLPIWETTFRTCPPFAMPGLASPCPTATGWYASRQISAPPPPVAAAPSGKPANYC